MATKKELIQSLDSTPDAIKQLASGIISAAVTTYDKVRDTVGNVRVSLSAEMLKLGALCVKTAKGDFNKASTYFASATAGAEDMARVAHKQAKAMTKKPGMADVLPSWQPAKSVIAKAIEKHVDISNVKAYPSFSSVREAIKTERTPRAGGKTEGPIAIGLTAKFKAVMESLMQAAASCPKERHDEAADLLMPIVAAIEALRPATAEAIVEQATAEPVVLTVEQKREQLKRGGRRAA